MKTLSGPGVKVVEVRVKSTFVVGVRRGEADVGNAANDLAGAELGGVMEERVEEGDERSALAASCLV